MVHRQSKWMSLYIIYPKEIMVSNWIQIHIHYNHTIWLVVFFILAVFNYIIHGITRGGSNMIYLLFFFLSYFPSNSWATAESMHISTTIDDNGIHFPLFGICLDFFFMNFLFSLTIFFFSIAMAINIRGMLLNFWSW